MLYLKRASHNVVSCFLSGSYIVYQRVVILVTVFVFDDVIQTISYHSIVTVHNSDYLQRKVILDILQDVLPIV